MSEIAWTYGEKFRYRAQPPYRTTRRLRARLSQYWLKPVRIDGVRVQFRPLERTLFAALFNARGSLVSISALVATMWPDPEMQPDGAPQALSVHLWRLRQNIARTGFRVVNVKWRGYRMVRV